MSYVTSATEKLTVTVSSCQVVESSVEGLTLGYMNVLLIFFSKALRILKLG
jgi:hypothetical protein